MYFKKIVKDYFTFSKKERIGLMSLLVLILTIFLLPYFLETRSKSSLVPLHSLAALLDSGSMETEELTFSANQTSAEQNTMVPEVFPFDPNTLTAEGWKRMGLPDGLARTIINYRNKGGKFKKAEDLQKIWGMQPADYHRIAPYVRIAENVTVYPREPFPVTEKKERPFLMVDVNHADSTLLEKLPGIGPKLSARIVAYREKLGGFHKTEQLGEVYGLADSVFQKIRPHLQISGSIKKIPINHVPKEALKEHPYFRWKLANAVVEFRNQHGKFESIKDLEKILLIEATLLKKIEPYLDFD